MSAVIYLSLYTGCIGEAGCFPLFYAKSTVVFFLDLTIKIDKGRLHSLTRLHNRLGSVASTRNTNITIKHKPTFKVTNSEGYSHAIERNDLR